jgi:hypothetical protein
MAAVHDNEPLPFGGRTLWEGAILASLAHACFIAAKPVLSNEQYWEGRNYCVEDSSGSFGTITFDDNKVVGTFFSTGSDRNPFKLDQDYDLERYLAAMSSDLREIAKKDTLEFMLQRYRGAKVPIVTASLWGDSERLFGCDPWSALMSHGAHLVRRQGLEPERALSEWKSYYDLSAEQIGLVKELFSRRKNAASLPIALADGDREVLIQSGTDGVTQARELLASIQIEWDGPTSG